MPESSFWDCQDLWTDRTNKVERLTRLSTTVSYKINCKFPDKLGRDEKKRWCRWLHAWFSRRIRLARSTGSFNMAFIVAEDYTMLLLCTPTG